MKTPEDAVEEILEIFEDPKLEEVILLADQANKFTEEYQEGLREKLKDMSIPEGIAVLGKMLYDLSVSQQELSNKLSSIRLRFERESAEKLIVTDARDEVSRVSSELVQACLGLVVLAQGIVRGAGSSASFLIESHARNNVPLNLDVDPEKN